MWIARTRNVQTVGVKKKKRYTVRMNGDRASAVTHAHDSNDFLSGNSNEYRSLLVYGSVAFAFALLIRFFVAAPYLVSGASMDPTFHSSDYLIIDRISYQLDEPARGDVIVFRFPQDPSRSFIKRVIGLPGETVSIRGDVVTIENAEHPTGFTLIEPYIDPDNQRETNMRVVLAPNEYFVLGDNRRASADSRTWGALPRDHIIGRALVRLYPFNQLGINPGETQYIE